MILRINFLEVVSPTCGATPSNLNVSNLDIAVTVDDVSVIAETDWSSHVSAITNANGINVTSDIENSRYMYLKIDLVNVWDSIDVEINLSKGGYLDYNQRFTVFGYDLGNNPNQLNILSDPINYNVDMDVVLIPDTVLDGNNRQTEGYSKFAMYRKPVSEELYIANLAGNITGLTTYVANASGSPVSFIQGSPTIIPTTLTTGLVPSTIDQQIKFYDAGNPRTLLSTCTTGDINVLAAPVFLPPAQLVTINSNACPGSDFVHNAALEAQALIDFNATDFYFVDDSISYLFATMDLTWTFINYEGATQITTIYPGIATTPVFSFPNATYNFPSLPVVDEGDYIINLVIDTPIYTQNLSLVLEGCNRWRTTVVGNEITIFNISGVSLDITVSKMDDCGDFQEIATATLSPCDVYTTVWEDGIYQVTVTDGVTTDNNNYIVIESLKTLFDSVLEAMTCNELSCEEQEFLNAFIVNYFYLALYSNQNSNFDTFYTTLSTTKSAKLYTASKALSTATSAAQSIVNIQNGSSC